FAAGAAVILFTDRRQRGLLLLSIAVLGLAAYLFTEVTRSEVLSNYFEKTFSSEESWSKRTTGRAEQWAAIPNVIADSPVWGFGPGNGRRISVLYAHKNIIWHALYMQFAAETGLLGLALLAILLGALLRRGW